MPGSVLFHGGHGYLRCQRFGFGNAPVPEMIGIYLHIYISQSDLYKHILY